MKAGSADPRDRRIGGVADQNGWKRNPLSPTRRRAAVRANETSPDKGHQAGADGSQFAPPGARAPRQQPSRTLGQQRRHARATSCSSRGRGVRAGSRAAPQAMAAPRPRRGALGRQGRDCSRKKGFLRRPRPSRRCVLVEPGALRKRREQHLCGICGAPIERRRPAHPGRRRAARSRQNDPARSGLATSRRGTRRGRESRLGPVHVVEHDESGRSSASVSRRRRAPRTRRRSGPRRPPHLPMAARRQIPPASPPRQSAKGRRELPGPTSPLMMSASGTYSCPRRRGRSARQLGGAAPTAARGGGEPRLADPRLAER